ncbi:hypothetical protein TNCT_25111 [Trichonephila clavata]|uniref:Uncharacterized protein n=1 Tax=Trichonephila clavata TaxID=2740835 RepID=A0A8X6I202_TRICU|nr:hypothetical protein TNCT_25111 [Trichonephila clavata]
MPIPSKVNVVVLLDNATIERDIKKNVSPGSDLVNDCIVLRFLLRPDKEREKKNEFVSCFVFYERESEGNTWATLFVSTD